jgi:acetyl-CoA carboxylase biotin carboxylase subunit
MRGTAIECRIYAEDPDNNFLPSPGRINKVRRPAGPGVRDDSGIYEGWEVPVYYDSLLAKFCVWAETREAAINRLARALDEYVIEGIKTTLPFFRAVTQNLEFRQGDFDTGFIDRYLHQKNTDDASGDQTSQALKDLAIIAAVLHNKTNTQQVSAATPQATESRWKLYGRVAQKRF